MSDPGDSKHNGPVAAAVALVFLVLGWLGNAPFTASNSNEYAFNERIDFGSLLTTAATSTARLPL